MRKITGPLPGHTEPETLGWSQAICVLTAPPSPRECDGLSHLRTTAWFSVSRVLAACGFSYLFI